MVENLYILYLVLREFLPLIKGPIPNEVNFWITFLSIVVSVCMLFWDMIQNDHPEKASDFDVPFACILSGFVYLVLGFWVTAFWGVFLLLWLAWKLVTSREKRGVIMYGPPRVTRPGTRGGDPDPNPDPDPSSLSREFMD